MIKLHLTFLLIGCAALAQAQGVIVNADGTHSVVVNNGSTSTIVNSNGTHATAINNGSTSTVVNSNGTHSTAFHNGNTSVIVNPNGTHSTAFHNGTTFVIVNPDGTHSIGMNLGSTTATAPNNDKNVENQQDESRMGTWDNEDDYWFSEPKVKEKKVKKRTKTKRE